MNGNIIEEMLLEELKYRATKTGRSIQAEAQRFIDHQPKNEALSLDERLAISINRYREMYRVVNESAEDLEELCLG
jgi:plasmid stability protein